jgi:Flp pilus assembly protein TadB
MILLAGVMVAALLVVGAPLGVVALVGVAMVVPVWGLMLAVPVGALHLWRRRRSDSRSPGAASFLRSVTADVSTGRTLRQAIAGSPSPIVDDHVQRLCRAGAPMGEVAAALAPRLDGAGAAFVGLVTATEITGGSPVMALSTMLDQVEARSSLARDQRVAVAQARISAFVVGVVPLVLALALLVMRGVPEPGGVIVIGTMACGAVLMLAGAASVFVMSRRTVVR